jgi:hypothetical protein
MTKTSKKGIIVKVHTGKINGGYVARTVLVSFPVLPDVKI